MSPKTGRPLVGELKDIDIKVRIGQGLNEQLLNYAKKQNITRAEAVRRAIQLIVSEENK